MNVIDELATVCGEAHVRVATAVDAVAGVPSRWVVAPADAEAVGAVLRVAAERDLSVTVCGSGSKLDWGGPPAHVDIVLDTGRLAGVSIDHEGETISVGAGTPLRAVRAALARTGRRLALDVGSPAATVGGVIATDEAGPLRFAFGTPRDLVRELRFIRADGTSAVAAPGLSADPGQHEVSALLCGSYGTLGIITEATLRLEVQPAARGWITRRVRTPAEVHELTSVLIAGAVEPSAIEVDLPGHRRPGELSVLIEGGAEDAETRSRIAARTLGGDAEVSSTPPIWWGRYPFDSDDLALELTAPVADLHAAMYVLRDAAGGSVPVRGSAGAGVVHAALPMRISAERLGAVVTAVRMTLLARGGRCVLLRAPRGLRAVVPSDGPITALPTLRRLKERFDPERRLAPGRLPGGR